MQVTDRTRTCVRKLTAISSNGLEELADCPICVNNCGLISGAVPNEIPLHVAFTARSRAQVRAFYEAALAAGGTDNGGPGLRKMYHPMYACLQQLQNQ